MVAAATAMTLRLSGFRFKSSTESVTAFGASKPASRGLRELCRSVDGSRRPDALSRGRCDRSPAHPMRPRRRSVRQRTTQMVGVIDTRHLRIRVRRAMGSKGGMQGPEVVMSVVAVYTGLSKRRSSGRSTNTSPGCGVKWW